jgi:hypothetical protein
MLGRGQAVFDADVCAEPVKLVPAAGESRLGFHLI